MDTKNNYIPNKTNSNTSKQKTVFSLRVRLALRERGFEPLFEADNLSKPGYKCQKYEVTDEFMTAFSEIMKGGT